MPHFFRSLIWLIAYSIPAERISSGWSPYLAQISASFFGTDEPASVTVEPTVRALAVKTIDNNITYSECKDILFTVVSSWGDVNTDDTSVDNPRNLPKCITKYW